ncbi:mucin-2 isoform X2 [Lingula anatina]|uniref:Mucin-2 isoform X2 n=1 Tax=Lingula anatina TaxID=7574 RepID=A0A1S3HN60_LINAN|nr:mucin-2 isoform X2 [Lingula anatina]|eukprot:XP_013387503.1 mucin-2 isoform X2 [Lingula anatina]
MELRYGLMLVVLLMAITAVEMSKDSKDSSRYKNNECTGKKMGDKFAVQGECNAYIHCAGRWKKPTKKTCEDGKVFDSSLGYCNDAYALSADNPCYSPMKTEEKTTPSTPPSPKSTVVPPAKDLCADKKQGDKFAVPGECNAYYECVSVFKKTRKRECAPGTVFDASVGVCNHAYALSASNPCFSPMKLTEKATPSTTSMTKESTTPKPPTVPTIKSTAIKTTLEPSTTSKTTPKPPTTPEPTTTTTTPEPTTTTPEPTTTTTPEPTTTVPLDKCAFKGQYYAKNEQFSDGCDKICVCVEPPDVYSCTERCYKWNLAQMPPTCQYETVDGECCKSLQCANQVWNLKYLPQGCKVLKDNGLLCENVPVAAP